MKSIFSSIYRAFCHFALAFTGIVLFFGKFLVDENLNSLKAESISIFAAFSIIFGISSFVFSTRIPSALKTVIHFIINSAAFIATFGSGKSAAQVLVSYAVFVVIYFAVLICSVFLKKLVEKLDGKNVRSKKSEK